MRLALAEQRRAQQRAQQPGPAHHTDGHAVALRALPDYDALFGVDFDPTPTSPTDPDSRCSGGSEQPMTTTARRPAARDPTAGRPTGCRSMLAYLTRVLKTPTIGRVWEELAAQARDENWSHEEYLAAVLQRQVADRESAGTTMRIRTAHFPAVKTLEDFNLDHLPSLRRDVLAHLATGTFVAKAENVILLGPPGIGKTHLAIGLGVKAAQAGYSVLFDTANNWITRLADAHQAGRLETELKKIRRYKLIIIDEVGYIPFDQDAANLFFQLIASRYEARLGHGHLEPALRPLGRDLLRRRRRRSHDRPPRPPRRGPHPHRRLLPHPRPPRTPRQAQPHQPELTNHPRGQDSRRWFPPSVATCPGFWGCDGTVEASCEEGSG